MEWSENNHPSGQKQAHCPLVGDGMHVDRWMRGAFFDGLERTACASECGGTGHDPEIPL